MNMCSRTPSPCSISCLSSLRLTVSVGREWGRVVGGGVLPSMSVGRGRRVAWKVCLRTPPPCSISCLSSLRLTVSVGREWEGGGVNGCVFRDSFSPFQTL